MNNKSPYCEKEIGSGYITLIEHCNETGCGTYSNTEFTLRDMEKFFDSMYNPKDLNKELKDAAKRYKDKLNN